MGFDLLNIPIPQFRLTGLHLDRPACDPDLVCERRELQRIAAPKHEIGDLPDGDTSMGCPQPENIGGRRGDRLECRLPGQAMGNGIAGKLAHEP